MHHFVLIPDKFKGTMSSSEICTIMKRSILRFYPDADVKSIPVADGGEGSVEAFLQAVGGERITVPGVKGPYGKPMEGFYGILPDGTAVLEMAATAGFALVGDDKHPDHTTTYGVGQLMLDAAKRGCRKMIIGLGGSSTNDAGCGCAAACGVTFRDAEGNPFVPVGGSLDRVHSIDLSTMNPVMHGVQIVAMCDIDNPFYGLNGAAYIFAPQKGADPLLVKVLDQNLMSLASVIKKERDIDIQSVPGSGAAGGMGGGMKAFFGATLQMGIETILDAVHFDQLMEHSDMVFTGEGKIDGQSLRGKVVIGVARAAKRHNVPVIAIVGDIADDVEGAYEEGVTGIFSINRLAIPYSESKLRAKGDLEKTMDNFLHCLTVLQK